MDVEAVLFDTFGTVVDWRRGVRAALDEFAKVHGLSLDSEWFALRWRALYQPSMEPVRNGTRGFVPLDQLHEENLRTVLGELGIDPDAFTREEIRRLNHAWHRLPPWPDSVAGLTSLRRSVIVGPLSNGNTSLLVRMAKNAGLPWDVVLGSDVLHAYKPQREAYVRAASFLDLEPGQVMLVAAHNGDLAAAKRAGLRTGFVARPEEYGPGQDTDLEATGDWDLIAGDIAELAEKFHTTR
jgi:2-haloacid dehalogenase